MLLKHLSINVLKKICQYVKLGMIMLAVNQKLSLSINLQLLFKLHTSHRVGKIKAQL